VEHFDALLGALPAEERMKGIYEGQGSHHSVNACRRMRFGFMGKEPRAGSGAGSRERTTRKTAAIRRGAGAGEQS
jgi:hypothetical protein